MAKPPFLRQGAIAHLRAAATHVLIAARHVAWAIRVVLGHVLAGLVALIVVFEEWGWRPLADALGRLARLAPLAALERLIQRLPPYAALAVFGLPSVLLFPLKLLAVYLVAQGYKLTAAALFIGAKVVGTAVVARLFLLTRAQLMTIAWFKRAYDVLMPMKEALTAWVRASAAWRYGRVVKARLIRALGPLVASVRTALARLFGIGSR